MREIMMVDIAKVAHEAIRALCLASGDQNIQPWGVSAKDMESSLESVRFHLDNPDATPEATHQNWSAQKLRDGWQYGPVKDPVAKTHPCLVPYDQLPFEQRAKDYVFKAVVDALRDA